MGSNKEHPGIINTKTISQFIPGLSVDNVIFGFHENQLKVLLLEAQNRKDWMLPGGYIEKEESVDDAAKRVLFNRTGLKKVYLQQFSVFGDPRRSRESLSKGLIRAMNFDQEVYQWFLQRFITIGYYALVEFDKVNPVPDPLSVSCAWIDIGKLPHLIFDHKEIIKSALVSLRQHLNYQPIGYNLLPQEFTMKSLQSIYETILDRKLDRANFNRKMLSLGILEKKKKLFSGGAHKAPYLYSFSKKEYFRVLKEGFGGEF
jgi:8-oxo-dGTP diphosphatase